MIKEACSWTSTREQNLKQSRSLPPDQVSAHPKHSRIPPHTPPNCVSDGGSLSVPLTVLCIVELSCKSDATDGNIHAALWIRRTLSGADKTAQIIYSGRTCCSAQRMMNHCARAHTHAHARAHARAHTHTEKKTQTNIYSLLFFFLRTYLVQFPHRAQSFHFMRAVFSLLQALITHGRLTLHTVHA